MSVDAAANRSPVRSLSGWIPLILAGTALALLGRWTHLDAGAVVAKSVGLLNGVVIGTALVGLAVQGKFDHWKAHRGTRMKAKVLAGLSEDERTALKKASAAKTGAFAKFFKPKKAG